MENPLPFNFISFNRPSSLAPILSGPCLSLKVADYPTPPLLLFAGDYFYRINESTFIPNNKEPEFNSSGSLF